MAASTSAKQSRRPEGGAFVVPGTNRFYLWGETAETPGAEWIDLKKELSYGDEQDMAGKVVRSIRIPEDADEDEKNAIKRELEVMLDIAIDGPFKILVWVEDWNLQGPSGKVVPLEFDSIKQLRLPWSDEVNQIINDYAESIGMGKGRRKNKNGSTSMS